MRCPKCNQDCAQELADEVDIGVGTQRHVYGWECESCGQVGVCDSCGAPDGIPHASWCDELKRSSEL